MLLNDLDDTMEDIPIPPSFIAHILKLSMKCYRIRTLRHACIATHDIGMLIDIEGREREILQCIYSRFMGHLLLSGGGVCHIISLHERLSARSSHWIQS
jgi:hypothetical protein